jgi:hypothetical protein
VTGLKADPKVESAGSAARSDASAPRAGAREACFIAWCVPLYVYE